jgi:hypothetical protein
MFILVIIGRLFFEKSLPLSKTTATTAVAGKNWARQ